MYGPLGQAGAPVVGTPMDVARRELLGIVGPMLERKTIYTEEMDAFDAAAQLRAERMVQPCRKHWVYATPPRAQGWVPPTGAESREVYDDAMAKIDAAFQLGIETLDPGAFATLKKYAATCPSLISRAAARNLQILEGKIRVATYGIHLEEKAAREAEAAREAAMQPEVIQLPGAQRDGGALPLLLAAGAAAALLL